MILSRTRITKKLLPFQGFILMCRMLQNVAAWNVWHVKALRSQGYVLRQYDGNRGVPELLEEASGQIAEDSEKTEAVWNGMKHRFRTIIYIVSTGNFEFEFVLISLIYWHTLFLICNQITLSGLSRHYTKSFADSHDYVSHLLSFFSSLLTKVPHWLRMPCQKVTASLLWAGLLIIFDIDLQTSAIEWPLLVVVFGSGAQRHALKDSHKQVGTHKEDPRCMLNTVWMQMIDTYA